MSSFEINKVNTFPALTGHCLVIFLSNLPNTEENALVANLDKKSLANGASRSISAFLPRLSVTLPNVLLRITPN